MKQSTCRPLPYLIAAVVLSGVGSMPAQTKRPVLPAPPSVLIKTLPRPLEGWKVIRSTADSQFMRWVQTTAVRMFEEIPKPPKPRRGTKGSKGAKGTASGPPKTPATLKVSITDTGMHRSMTAPFDDFEVGTNGPVERFRVGSYPATAISLGEAGERVQIFVEGRFVVEYLFTGIGRADLKPWIENANFSQFGSVPDGGKRLTRVVNVTRIDEMNPARNRTYALGITTTAEIRAILREQEALEKSGREGAGLE